MLPVWAALVCAAVAAVLTPWARKLAHDDSRFLRPWLTAAVAGVFGAGAGALASGVIELAAFALLAVAGGLLVAFDLAEHRLPDRIVFASYLGLYPLLALQATVTDGWGDLGRALAAGLALFFFFFVLILISPAGLGFGDVKLSGLLGGFLGWLGWSQVAAGVLAGVLINAVAALVVLVVTRNRKAEVPFGPSLIAGAALGAWLGPSLLPALA